MTNSQTYPWSGDRNAITNRIRELRGYLEKRDLSEAERLEMDELSAAVDDLTERVGAVEAEIGELADSQAIKTDAAVAAEESAELAEGRSLRPLTVETRNAEPSTRMVKPRTSTSSITTKGSPMNAHEDFDSVLRSWLRYDTDAEGQNDGKILRAYGVGNPRSLTIRTGLVTTAPDGKNIVPGAFESAYMTALKATCPFFNFCRVLNTQGSTYGQPLSIPWNNDATGPNALGAWRSELEQMPVKDPSLGQIQLGAHSVGSGIIETSVELTQDSGVNLPALLGQIVGERVGRVAAQAFVNGTGVGQPKGISLAFPAGQLVTSTASGAIAADDVLSLTGGSAIDAAYLAGGNCGFLMHPSTLMALRKLKASGTGEYLFQPNAQAGEPEKLFGFPVYLSSDMDEIASGKTAIYFGDWSRYLIRQAQGIQLRRSDEYGWSRLAVAWMAWARLDGLRADDRAFVGLKCKA